MPTALRSVQCNRVRSFPTSSTRKAAGQFVGNGPLSFLLALFVPPGLAITCIAL